MYRSCGMMTGYKRIYLDTAPVIYLIENNGEYYNKLVSSIIKWNRDGCGFFTSVITRAEFCVHPYRTGRYDLIKAYDDMLNELKVNVIGIDDTVADTAARLRGKYSFFKSMDTLQISASMRCMADVFLTNDKQLRQCSETRILLISELDE